ncbi:hypothetical protein EJ03DRAFT_370911 [Teratosphaeria nubilosa]|uniref:Vps41 beta-propeller domain-containing protein n=1 Tax=Teratosphaeria nubilosa TaxID=161662 RepID=A0A6G1LN93_9PEZI|nr:hypothetical protein EJ03DRAFT_370911 [Teratosphaeria nubilosa]
MSDHVHATDGHGALQLPPPAVADDQNGGGHAPNPDEQPDDVDEEDDDEPKLKYAKLTGSLTGVYRNGDSTSAFAVAGDKMVMGTHNGSVHVLGLPGLQGVRSYRGHNATVTSLSVSPVPPPPSTVRGQDGSTQILSPSGPQGRAASLRDQSTAASTRSFRATQRQLPQQEAVSNTPANQIYIGTSSLDGHVCVQSLVDSKDVLLRNFARPVQAVALSPDYKNDRTYLSGGLAEKLILTVGGKAGVSADANTTSAAAAASGWLGSIGLGANTGRDTVLHSGEGPIHTIKWSLSGKWVAWVNERGVKVMRSHLKLGSEDSEDAWRRVAFVEKPNRKGWKDMAGVWKARCEWIDEKSLEDKDLSVDTNRGVNGTNGMLKSAQSGIYGKKIERLVVGWGDTAWVLHVQPGVGYTAHSGQKHIGKVESVHKLHFTDCIVSGVSMYSPSLLIVLAYRTRDDDDKPIASDHTTISKGGRPRHRRTGLAPELRLINVADGSEVDVDELSISRFEALSAQDYHLSTMSMPQPIPADKSVREQRGALEAAWEAAGGGYASRLFSSAASVRSGSSGDRKNSIASPPASVQGMPLSSKKAVDSHPFVIEPGLKIFIQSPYDCILAVKRELSDHLEWLIERERYADAWQLVDEHPEVVDASTVDQRSYSSQPSTPGRMNQGSLAEFFADSDTASDRGSQHSAANKEKRRIGDLWLQQLVVADNWAEAGKIAAKVLGTSSRWDHWVWTFAQAGRFDEITPSIPSTSIGLNQQRALPSLVYEVILGHYLSTDPPRLKELLDQWDPELFDVRSVITAIEDRLQSGNVSEDSVEGGEHGRDWRILVDALARLYLADGRARDALRCYIRAQNADAAIQLVRHEKLLDAIDPDEIPGLILLRVSKSQLRNAPLSDLEEAASEPITLLAEEALRGTVMPATIIRQLERKGPTMQPFIFYYLRTLWRGLPDRSEEAQPRSRLTRSRDAQEGHALVEDHADLAVSLFAEYDRELLMNFLRTSTLYSYEKAAQICEQRHYIPELVYILSKTGQTKRALWLIIGELGDVSQAIAFAKENGELWDDLLDYSMNRPRFIRGLLEEVGTAIDPVKMVRRIPEGLEIEGLKEGIQKLVREYEIQHSISEGVARVLKGEVNMGMETLRAGRKKAVRFEVVHEGVENIDLSVRDVPTKPVARDTEVLSTPKRWTETEQARAVKPGHCVGCGEAFHEEEKQPLIGFACGHVYHLCCLLRAANPDDSKNEERIERLMRQLGYDDDDDDDDDDGGGGGGGGGGSGEVTRTVGAKVAHAHVIRNVVEGGCRVCVVPEGA